MDSAEAMDNADDGDQAVALPPPSKILPSEVLNPRLLGSVVKLFVTKAEPNYCMPWQVKPQRQSNSSAFVVAGRRLITNAHCVLCETSVRARKRGSAKKFTAKVLTINYQSDLALLSIDDDSFWEGLDPLDFEQVPELQDTVVVAGYPTGGDNISVTKGVVSRVDLRDYGHGAYLLTIQIDAAINPGNSGGPAFKNDKVVGIARAHLKAAQNIGYIIPLPVIRHFLECYDLEHTDFQGLCGIGFRFQVTENESLRAKLRMQVNHTGVLVTTVSSQGPEAGCLQVGDVIMEVDGVKVADDGTIPYRGTTWSEERISFLHQFNHKFKGDTCSISILRAGKEEVVSVTAAPVKTLVPSMHGFDSLPSYFVVGGLVFVPLTTRFLKDYFGSDWRRRCPEALLHVISRGFQDFKDEEIVVLCHLLISDVNYGYRLYTPSIVSSLNGRTITSLLSLVSLVTNCEDEFMEFKLDDSSVIVLETSTARARDPEILVQHNIPENMSKDVRTQLETCAAGDL